jgi:dihydrofolate reductase
MKGNNMTRLISIKAVSELPEAFKDKVSFQVVDNNVEAVVIALGEETLRIVGTDTYSKNVKVLKKYDEENIYIIGGESIYRQMLPYCDVAHVTKIDHAYEADAYFPDLDSDPEWEITADSDEQVYFDITYQFLKYERKKA